jgi:hypothetical protein
MLHVQPPAFADVAQSSTREPQLQARDTTVPPLSTEIRQIRDLVFGKAWPFALGYALLARLLALGKFLKRD